MKRHVRKQLIVNPRIQLKVIFLTIIAILIPTLITFLSLHHLIQVILIDAKIDNEMVYAAIMFLSRKVYLILACGFVSITILLLIWVSLFVHRIVGPLYRLDRELEKAIQGEKIPKIKFRKNDCFSSIAEKINILIEKLHSSN